MTDAPTTRETADHAELARLAEAANVEMPSKKRSGWYRDRSAFTHAANPATVLAILSEIAALRGERDEAEALASKHFVALREKQDDAAILKHGKLQAERQRDELRNALEFYANPEIYKPHPHGLAFDDRDVSFRAKSVLANQGAK